jgi:Nif-specific regulatory protein
MVGSLPGPGKRRRIMPQRARPVQPAVDRVAIAGDAGLVYRTPSGRKPQLRGREVRGTKEPPGVKARATVELDVLYRVSQALAHRHEVAPLLQEVFDILETEMGFSYGTLTLRQPDTDIFVIQASRGLTAEERTRGQYRLGEGITGTVAQTGKAELVTDTSRDPRFLDRTRARRGAQRAFICVPIIHRGQVIGTISIDRPPADISTLRQDLGFLQLLANLLAEAVAGIREQIGETESLKAENERLRRQLGERYQPQNIVGNSKSMRAVYDQIAQVADSMATVLIRGESGTGKELVARAIHYGRSRRGGPFVSVNCAALPENLIESELFGHEKGSFTGAVQRRKGRFELANGGTIFLDEIGDVSAPVQIRLLRVLQERTFERVGADHTLTVNVRVLAATSRDLEAAIKAGRFREDLYYRLNVFPILLPPLRERRSDILLLAEHFLQKYSQVYGKTIRRISTTAINMMMAYHWPGNVRELENCIERAVLTSTDDVIHGYTLPPTLQTSEATHTAILPDQGASLRMMVESFERELIVDALKKHRGNAAAAARFLQSTPRIVNYRIHHLGIKRRDYR